MTSHDEIVQEVRRHRSALLAEHGGDLRKLMDHMRELDRVRPGRVVSKQQLDRRRAVEAAVTTSPH